MPKIVDHEQRRSELAAAVWRLASRDGLEAVTLRAVSAEAGWSTGALNHYFSDKEKLLLFAFQIVAHRSEQHVVIQEYIEPGQHRLERQRQRRRQREQVERRISIA